MNCGHSCRTKQTSSGFGWSRDKFSKQIIAAEIGDHSEESARKLYEQIPDRIRETAVIYIDLWKAYGEVIPAKQHIACEKGSGLTNTSRDLTAHCDKEFQDWSERVCHFQKSKKTMKEQSDILSVITTKAGKLYFRIKALPF